MKNFLKKFAFYKILIIFYKSARKGKIRRIYHWLFNGHIVKWHRIRKWVRGNHKKFLQIGGGFHFNLGKEWMNGDLIAGDIYLNATKKLPFSSNTIDIIFTEQFFEHLSQEEGVFFLSEVYRVLKKGGVIRQSTPDLEKIISLYHDKNNLVSLKEVLERHISNHRSNCSYARLSGCQFINDMFRLWGHKFIYDKKDLKDVLESSGFLDFEWVSFGVSSSDNLKELERHADKEWMKNGFVMIYEAKK